MKAFRRALVLATSLLALLSGCGEEGHYAAAVSWAINGLLPNPARCQEQGIVRGRFEVRDQAGKNEQTLEADCASIVLLSDGEGGFVEFGGFETSDAFAYDVPYPYTISLVDQAGEPLAPPVNDTMVLDEGEGNFNELPPIDYLQPDGSAAALHGEWRVIVANTPIDDLAASCTKADVDNIYILVTTVFDEAFNNALPFVEAKCHEGQFNSNGKVLATGDYLFRYEAVSSAGSTVQLGEPINVYVDGSGDVILPRETFRIN